ncbi:hypothetical protein AUL39_02140 [Tractidigestivibacter scatoligenes]|jgi:DeoR/GlpR family transcriptional regulator of sugar metabolism|uniref:HTH deoR-type domain-containing protein n=1 Tax=Tractidigestivibacter scatoligenes TaxID=1299998 RepID=A0A117J4N1_TRASO|nr:DeoR/GlpR family DNA-binding transcription regulator [Tractidigestivibacter scatoligenes]KUH59154.1 hypothetical protein AUL39_02140 [Tractidigestivibacter scatoligenes]
MTAGEIGEPRELRSDDRRKAMVERLNDGNRITVKEMAKEFGVSEVTIRSDLEVLERGGKLKRVRGGAVMLDRMRDVADIQSRMTINVDKKKVIAQLANSLVSDGDSIIIDSGSTAFEFAKTLVNKRHITVLTQDINTAMFIDSELPSASVVLLGGALRPRHGYCWGPLTIGVINQLYVDKAFIGSNGFSPSQGFMTENPYGSEVKRSFIEHARHSIILIDSSKIGIHSFIKFADIGEVDHVVMDSDPEGLVSRAASTVYPSPSILLP